MGRRALKVCSCNGCPAHPGSCPDLVRRGRCGACVRQADKGRGTARERGYNTPEHQAFRRDVLRRDRICVLCGKAPSVHADHHPVSRRDLVAAGADPNDPRRGRGLCPSCHGSETAKHQPGGWNAR